jgi:hypothetical protein
VIVENALRRNSNVCARSMADTVNMDVAMEDAITNVTEDTIVD